MLLPFPPRGSKKTLWEASAKGRVCMAQPFWGRDVGLCRGPPGTGPMGPGRAQPRTGSANYRYVSLGVETVLKKVDFSTKNDDIGQIA